MKKYLALAGFLVLLLAGFSLAGVRVYPDQVEIVLDKEQVAFPVSVTNASEIFKTNVRVQVLGPGDDPRFGDLSLIYSGVNQLKVEPADFWLNPGESREIILRFIRPFGYDWHGELYTYIRFKATGPGLDPASFFDVFAKIISPSGLTKTGLITQVKADQLQGDAPVEISAFLKNTGNTKLNLAGKALIHDKNNRLIGKVVFPNIALFPGVETQVKGNWLPPILPAGDYFVDCRVENEDNSFQASGQALFTVAKAYNIKRKGVEVLDFPAVETAMKSLTPISLRVKNSGNTSLEAGGLVEIVNEAGGKVAVIPLESVLIGVDQTADLTGVFEADLPVGEYRSVAKVFFGGPESVSSDAKFVIVERLLVREGKITDFKITQQALKNQVTAKIGFENSGNVPLDLVGTLVANKNGIPVLTKDISVRAIEPGETRVLEVAAEGFLPPGLYQAELKLFYGRDKYSAADTSFFKQ